MALIKCAECGKEISSNAKPCPHCGIKVSNTTCPECGRKLKGTEEKCRVPERRAVAYSENGEGLALCHKGHGRLGTGPGRLRRRENGKRRSPFPGNCGKAVAVFGRGAVECGR